MYGVWGIIYYIAEIAEQDEEVRIGFVDLVAIDTSYLVVVKLCFLSTRYAVPWNVEKKTGSRGNLPYL